MGWDRWLLFALPVPVLIDWWTDHLGLTRYSPTRQVLTSLAAAPAVGVGMARYLRDPGDPLFWSVVGVFAVLCLIPWLLAMVRPGRTGCEPGRDSAGPGDAAELEGIVEQLVMGDDPHGQPAPTGTRERQLGHVGDVSV